MQTVQYIADLVFSGGLVMHGVLFIPQAAKIWADKRANNVSLLTFAGFNLVQLAAITHGYFVHDYILMCGVGFSFITCFAVTIGILVYRK